MTQPYPGFCPQCHSPVQAAQRFCQECGASLSRDANSSTNRSNQTVVRQNTGPAPFQASAQDTIPAGSSTSAPGYPFQLAQAQENLIPPPPPPPPSSLFPPLASSPYEGTSAPGFPTVPVAPSGSQSSAMSGASAPDVPQ